jgi:hypothetical protein
MAITEMANTQTNPTLRIDAGPKSLILADFTRGHAILQARSRAES